jgi:GAF domain-containing protein
MKKQLINYETLLKVTKVISHSRNPEEVVLITVESIKTALDVKGCSVFLINRKTDELEVAASYGLSDEYISKGPVSALRSIALSLEEGPVAIYDVSDDPRIQYPDAAKNEIYTSEHWEFTLEDVNFVQAMAQIAGMAIEMARQYKGLKNSIEILKTMRDPKVFPRVKLAKNINT